MTALTQRRKGARSNFPFGLHSLVPALLVHISLPCSAALPQPLSSHPGNIFLAGEEVVISLQGSPGEDWEAKDYERQIVARGKLQEGRANIGRLPVGYYEVWFGSATSSNHVSAGVLEPLHALSPASSPIGIDVAMGWFFPKEKMAAVANLCRLAGFSHVRDRMTWGELEPERGKLATTNRYDWAADAQAGAGLQVLQVSHASPGWANPNPKRFPLDLRDTYNFHKAIAQRWRGKVVGFEPWNEADGETFGGHTGSEMASLQKTAYLGLKAGNPDVIACLNVLAFHRLATLQDLNENQAWPYFDTFNLHHYESFERLSKAYADFRSVSAGKPLWVTECSVPVKWQGDERLKEPTDEDLRIQSERVPKIYAHAIYEGAQKVFYFMLPNYSEGQTQFGILHDDLTPRPVYLAAAAAGRLLADARPLGSLITNTNAAEAAGERQPIHAFVFDAKPDGKRARVVVAWADQKETLGLPQRPVAIYDHLGRPIGPSDSGPTEVAIGPAPIYVIFSQATRLPLNPPPALAAPLPGEPSPLVLQTVVPEQEIDCKRSLYKLSPATIRSIPIFLYNFGHRKVQGTLRAAIAPASVNGGPVRTCRLDSPAGIEISPGQRLEIPLKLSCATNVAGISTIRITGDFGVSGKPILSLRFAREESKNNN
ncbi:MAG: hypothetical protein C5B50_13400 [Verrucomicrobia bacterium]|nr:MAG: hypothetical protein C5B50_13400 [Verrucomicrobiota bacterium]